MVAVNTNMPNAICAIVLQTCDMDLNGFSVRD